MDDKQKTEHEKMFQEDDFFFSFGKCKKMAEMMRRYCAGEGRMADCCAMMKKMKGCGTGEDATNSGGKP
jgi:hypothetical protein